MSNHSSIQYFSGLLSHPDKITHGDHSTIMQYRQAYPYFVPVRYLEALEMHKDAPFAPAMISAIYPYMGNWLLFCSFLQNRSLPHMDVPFVEAIPENGAEPHTRAGGKTQVPEYIDYIPHEETKPAGQPAQPVTAGITEPAPGEQNTTAAAGKTENTEQPAEKPKGELLQEMEQVAVSPLHPAHGGQTSAPAAEKEKVEEQIPAAHTGDTAATPAAQQEPEYEHTADEGPLPVMLKLSTGNFPITVADPQPAEVPAAKNEMPAPVMSAAEAAPVPEVVVESGHDHTPAPLVSPVYSMDYFLQQGEKVSDELPSEMAMHKKQADTGEVDKSLMVMLSFSEWLLHFKNSADKQEEEKKEQKALKTLWQMEKLASIIEEENGEIPEDVFEMAVNSITREDGLASESLADIYIKQGKFDKAIEMYRKLSLRNLQKSSYFAHKIEEVLKEKKL